MIKGAALPIAVQGRSLYVRSRSAACVAGAFSLRKGRLVSLGGGRGAVGFGPVLVFAQLSCEQHKDEEDKAAHVRHEAYQIPPSAVARVVQAAHRHGDGGDERGEAEDEQDDVSDEEADAQAGDTHV